MTNPLNNDAASNTGGEGQQQPATKTEPAAQAGAPAADGKQQQQPTDGDAKKSADGTKPAEGDQGAPKQGDEGTEEGADDQGGEGKKPDEPVKKAPEKYELKLAETVKLTPEVQEQFEAIARELDLPQEAAQKLIDLAPALNKMQTAQLIETAKATTAKWAEETRADKDIGGGGNKEVLAANLALAAKARNAFATPELLTLLDTFDPKRNPNGTGLGNHPEVVRLFVKLGKSISEDNKVVVGGTTPEKTDKTPAQRLYGNTTPKK